MTAKWLKVTEEIILAADQQHPADAVMRDILRPQRRLVPEQKRMISAAVFAYFRWFGWLDGRKPFAEQIEYAQELDERFNNDPTSFAEKINPTTSLWTFMQQIWMYIVGVVEEFNLVYVLLAVRSEER